MKSINPLNGQSNIDLCLESVGSLDNFMSFLNKNSIDSTITTKKTPYQYETSDVKNKLLTGYIYNTGRKSEKFFDPSFFDPTFFE